MCSSRSLHSIPALLHSLIYPLGLGLLLIATTDLPSLKAQITAPFRYEHQADYNLQVQLHPAQGSITVSGHLNYRNDASRSHDSIPVHLWANAYANRQSPFGKQKLRFGETAFAFASEDELGGYRSLTFNSDQLRRVSTVTPELQWLHLNEPLRPGQTLRVKFSYELDVPAPFSRMGREGDAYQITQWYPKVARFDTAGWHTRPYLDFGEYFNDFGCYEVEVTVPGNGLVAASGTLVNEVGIAARAARMNLTRSAPEAVGELAYDTATQEVFQYRLARATDFAFFVHPRFRVTSDTAVLSDDRRVPVFAYYPPEADEAWGAAAGFGVRALTFGDSLIGAYPFDQFTSVAAPLGVGGGIVLAQGGAEDAAVGVDRVVGDGVAEELEVNADLVRAAGKWEAVDDTVAFVFVG